VSDNNEKNDLQVITRNAEETYRLGKNFVSSLKKGDVVALYGELGSGKTVFVKGACAGLEITGEVTSPSFVIMHEYTGRINVYHFDFYRIKSGLELETILLDDYFYGDGISFIEWPEIAEPLLPDSSFKLFFKRLIEKNKIIEGGRVINISAPKNRRIKGI